MSNAKAPKIAKKGFIHMAKITDSIKNDPKKLAIAGTIAGLVVGLAVGKFALGTNLGNVTPTKATQVQSTQSSEIIANYTYDGANKTISLGDMIEYLGEASIKNDDGSYDMPTTEQIVSYARAQIIQDAAKKQGITVSDEDRAKFLKDNYGTDSVEDFATSTNQTTEQATAALDEALIQRNLYAKVAGETPEMPAFPDYPEDNKEDAKTKEYAEYIIKIAGDEYKDGKWAEDEGDFAKALPEFDGKTASYKDATAAYQVIYNRASATMDELNAKWLEFENGILKDCAITISTLIQ